MRREKKKIIVSGISGLWLHVFFEHEENDSATNLLG